MYKNIILIKVTYWKDPEKFVKYLNKNNFYYNNYEYNKLLTTNHIKYDKPIKPQRGQNLNMLC